MEKSEVASLSSRLMGKRTKRFKLAKVEEDIFQLLNFYLIFKRFS